MTPPSAQSILFQPTLFYDEEEQKEEETSLLFCCRDELLAKFKEEYGHSCSVPTCCWPQNDQQLAQWVEMLRRYQHKQELIEQGQFVDVRSFVLSGTSHVVQQPLLTANTANAGAVSCAFLNTTLDVVTVGGTSSSHDDSDGVEEATNNGGNTLHRNELLKDNMSQFYQDLAKARLGSDDLSSACSSDEESDWDEEEEEEDDLCFRGLVEDSSSSDLFDSFKSRYGGISEWP